jgi:tetratricopeptide (TPR) repeat protein
MRIHKALLLFSIIILSSAMSIAQQAAALDSMRSSFAKAKTPEEKVFWLDILARTAMSVDPQQADAYGNQLITFAEETRDRKLMVKAYMSNGTRCSYFVGQKEYTNRSIEYYNKALEIARQNKMEDETGAAQLKLCAVHLAIPDKDKALSYINQAFSLISTLKNDSLKAEAHNSYGLVYQAKNEKTLSLRYFLNGLQIAEKTKIHELKRNSYLHLSNFYSRIEDYDKAIDYFMKASKELDHVKVGNVGYQRTIDFNSLGNLFANKKNHDIAISYFERSIPGYLSLLNQY